LRKGHLLERKERRPHARPEKYLLSTIVVCQHCGNRMYGVRRTTHSGHVPFYQCNPSPAVSPYDPNCPHPAVRVERLEAFVLGTIRERLLEAGAEERIREAILRAKRRDATKVSRDERHLADLRRKIERGTENLALADHDDFAAISKLLTRWRKEEAALAERLEQRGRELEPLPEALRVLARFADVPGNLAKAVTKEAIEQFHDFAISLVSGAGSDLTWRQLFELWRLENPSVAEYGENVLAIQESLDAMDAGRMRPFSDFDAEFRKRYGITSHA
jgi:hypothetical protein